MTAAVAPDLWGRATAFHKAQRFEEAAVIYSELLEVGHDTPELLTYLASALRSAGRQEEAIEIYGRLEPSAAGKPDFWFNRGNAFNNIGRHSEAAVCYERALAMEPDNATILSNYAVAIANIQREDDAIALYRRALQFEPGQKLAAHNLANLLSDRGQLLEAADLLRRTVGQWPDLPEAHYNLGLVLLKLGDYANGSAEYEWRWETAGFFKKPGYKDMPVWDGRPFSGKRLIVHAEQGLGDTIQFSRLLGQVKSLGGDVVLHIPQRLQALMKTLPFDVKVTSHLSGSGANLQIPLMSLIHRLKLTLGSLPSLGTHLSADSNRADSWRQRLSLDRARKVVGFVWQGNPNSPAERGRSLESPEQLAPFASHAGLRMIALQKLGIQDLEPSETPSGWKVRGLSFTLEHPGPDMDDGLDAFVDTAAIMSALDLVVSVCTAPLHLAGALGRPAIALLRAAPDWRWMMQHQDTPWYPSMRLCRQEPAETYGPVIERAAAMARHILIPSSA